MRSGITVDKLTYKRLAARLDIKGANVIKGIQMDGLRVVGPVAEVAQRYYALGADEILLIDTVASLYGRDSMVELIREVTEECFVPVTVGGGVRSLQDADDLFRAGADKVALNTGAIGRPRLISEIAEKYGTQAVTVHIEAKSTGRGDWECYTESGREPSGLSVSTWLEQLEDKGAGEVLVTSVDRDGTRRGSDLDLLRSVRERVSIPVVAGSGVGTLDHLAETFLQTSCDGVALGASLHWGSIDLLGARAYLAQHGIQLRELESGA